MHQIYTANDDSGSVLRILQHNHQNIPEKLKFYKIKKIKRKKKEEREIGIFF
jgi:hypothetical protein